MQDFGTKADNSPPPGGQLSAAEFNNLATENENAVLRSGQSLSGASDTQLAQSLFLHGAKSSGFQDSGAANAYVATPISGASGVLLPASYAALSGASIRFIASASNTGPSTLNFGQTTGTLIGAKAIRTQSDAPLPANSIVAGQYVQLIYSPSFNAGAGAWALVQSTATTQPGNVVNGRMLVTAASATATYAADSIVMKTANGGASFLSTAVSEIINLATTGAGGMDTGAAPNNGSVAIYGIYNPATQATDLLATNATLAEQPDIYGGVNMPAGYTSSWLLTVVPTNGSGQFSPVFARGDHVWIPDNVFYTSATQQASLFIRDLSLVVPLNAKSGDFSTTISSSNATVSVLTGLAGSAAVSAGVGIGEKRCALTSAAIAGAGFQSHFPNIPIITPQTMYYRCTVASGTMSFSITCNGYSIR